jgi:SAM-dependent methyltransferase
MPTLAGRQVGRGSGVYLASSPEDDTPRQVVIDGRRLSRFMDSIYLDRPCEKLDVKKIQVLNEARRPLLGHDRVSAVNMRVRSALARGLHVTGARQVLEWGCGYHPMHELLDIRGYAGIDIDARVIVHNRKRHTTTPWYEADRDLGNIANESQDVIVSCFVFHFRLSRLHVATMRRALKPGGILLANVYRRSQSSRRELALRFERAGLRVHRTRDVQELCVAHEFWCLTRKDQPDSDVASRVLREVVSSIAGEEQSPISIGRTFK